MDTDTRARTHEIGALSAIATLVVGVLAGLLGTGFLGTGAAVAETPAADDDNQPCLDNVGITVVVDFRELGGGVNVRCAPGPVVDGFDALKKAGISYQMPARQGGFVCRIAGQPADDPCINTSPADAHWSYWIASRGGQWCYANVGAGYRKRPLPPGSIEGWSFSLERRSKTNRPPQYVPPAPIPGEAPNPIPASDCDAAVPPPPNPSPAPTTPTTALRPSTAEPVPSTPGGGAAGSSSGSTDQGARPGAAPTGDPAAVPDASSTTTADTDDLEEPPLDDAAGDEVALGLVSTKDDGTTEALGEVDLASDGSSGGSPVGLVAVVVAAVGLAAGAMVVVRRRRAEAASS